MICLRRVHLLLQLHSLVSLAEAEQGEWYNQAWTGKTCNTEDYLDFGKGITSNCITDCDCPPCEPFCATTGLCQNNKNFGRRLVLKETCLDQACPQPLGKVAHGQCNKRFVEDVDGVVFCQRDSDCPQDKDWWHDVWASGSERPHDGPAEATWSSCLDNKCVFTSATEKWVLCEDSAVIRVMSAAGELTEEYPCRRPEDCHLLSSPLALTCKTGRCVQADNTKPDLPPCRELQLHNNSFVTLQKLPTYLTPGTGQERRGCLQCRGLGHCDPLRPCRVGGKCYRAVCNSQGTCWCDKYRYMFSTERKYKLRYWKPPPGNNSNLEETGQHCCPFDSCTLEEDILELDYARIQKVWRNECDDDYYNNRDVFFSKCAQI